MVVDSQWNKNGCADLFFFAKHGPAGLTNCNASVQVKRDGKGGKRIKVTRFPANAYFETVTLSRPYMLPVPGRHWSNEVILLRALRDLKDDEQIFVDYGNGTMMNMFGVCSGEIVIPRPVAKNGASANHIVTTRNDPGRKNLPVPSTGSQLIQSDCASRHSGGTSYVYAVHVSARLPVSIFTAIPPDVHYCAEDTETWSVHYS
jgi:hypothetical protein